MQSSFFIHPPVIETNVYLSIPSRSLSENESLLTLPLWTNLYLVAAITLSMVLHFMILYVPFFTTLFVIVPLNLDEWQAVLWISLPVLFIDEALKWVSRTWIAPPTKLKKE